MKILDQRALRGPNYYGRYLTILMQLDIGGLEERPSDTVPDMADRLTALMPTLAEHRCTPGHPGGFLERIGRGTWAGHIVEHVAIELQNLIGFSVGFGRTLDTDEVGVYTVLYRYREEACGLAAGIEAVDLVERVFDGRDVDVGAMVDRLAAVRDAHLLGPSSAAIVEAAKARNIPHMRLREGSSYVQLGHGAGQQRFQATVTAHTSLIGSGIAEDKSWAKELLGEAGIPVPAGEVCDSLEEAFAAARQLGYPLAVKPLVGNHGRGVTPDVRDDEALQVAYTAAAARHDQVVVERHLPGHDHRLVVVGGQLVAAARREAARVVGDGHCTVRELVALTNRDPRRGEGHEKVLTRIHVDEHSERLLAQQGLSLDSRVAAGRHVQLAATCNLSTGGTATDVTDDVHPDVRYAAERIARLVGLDIIGIDLIAETLSRPLDAQSAGVVEVNAGPGFRMHVSPSGGQPRDVAGHVVDMLFPGGADGRIPITAVTGTNGKTTTARLIAHLLRQAGHRVGLACTGGIEVENRVIMRGDCSGPESARTVLREPSVEHAVLEVARGGIMRRGLGFDACDVGVLLNVAADHLGDYGLNTLDEMARCKSVVIDVVREGGTAVLNADDPRCLQAREWADGEVLLFSLDPDSRALRAHVHEQGVGFTVHEGELVMRQGRVETVIAPLEAAPITFGGRATFNVANALAAVAAGYALGLDSAALRLGLASFHPTFEQNPGRANLIAADGPTVLIDYAHNVSALEAIDDLIGALGGRRRIAVASAPGNRRDADLLALGAQLGRMVDHLYLCDTLPRDRQPGETPQLLRTGAESAIPRRATVEVLLEEHEAVDRALDGAEDGDLVLLLAEDVEATIERVRARRTSIAASVVST